ncbi:hypothetical protein [Tenacibaculum agarivorans]|uniref:hypothetical protein n=1 Tax=Tenacibaculum agarivorans TaxID=1908389 RepID=UPI00094B8634|nr:hypothetical protein [Tenacibaculum agarivorans]
MKRCIIILIFILSNAIYSQNNSEETYMLKFIDSLKSKKLLNGNPALVIDGCQRDYDLKNKNSLSIRKENIYSINYIKKEDAKIYGSIAEYGIISISTRLSQIKKLERASIHYVERGYILDNKIVNKTVIDKLDRKKIDSVNIITDLEVIKNRTAGSFDELIVITTRKLKE